MRFRERGIFDSPPEANQTQRRNVPMLTKTQIDEQRKRAEEKRAFEREVDAVRKAWGLTPPTHPYRDPRWFKKAIRDAEKAGRLPRRNNAYDNHNCVCYLRNCGFSQMIDHHAVIVADGERHVIFEPYDIGTEKAQQLAKQLGDALNCEAWVSLKSWHYPGRTIRVTLAPKKAELCSSH